jgi:NAD(P)-dependent dehydrogenase (short-subunit alcohol dehydrogenase family)
MRDEKEKRDLVGKRILITGGTAGIGKAAAWKLAARGAELVLLGRDRMRGERLAAEMSLATRNDSIYVQTCDLSSPEEVRRAVADFHRRHIKLDVLINNAGMFLRKRHLTPEGQEKTFAALYLGHFLLTLLLLESLKTAPQGRIICVTCPPKQARVNFEDPTLKKYSTLKAQYQAKGALMMFVRELSRRLDGTNVTINSLLPALMIKTDLTKQMPFYMRLPVAMFGKKPEEAADTEVWMATAPELERVSGRHFTGRTEIPFTGQVADDAACLRLWDLSVKLAGMVEASPAK